MSKQHKIKNYSKKASFNSSGRRTPPWKVILSALIVVGLVFVGFSIYPQLKDFIGGKMQPGPLPTLEENHSEQPPDTAQSEPPIEEDEPETPVIKQIHGAEISFETAKDIKQLEEFIKTLPEDINTLFINVKNNRGQVLFKTNLADAKAWGAVVENPIDLSSVATTVKKNGLNMGVRLAVLSDPVAARGNLDNAIYHKSGVIWIDNTLDRGGKPWTTPYAQGTRTYNGELIKELVSLGADCILLDYLHFPIDPTNSGDVKAVAGVSRADALVSFYGELKEHTGGVPMYVSISENAFNGGAEGNNAVQFGGDPATLGIDSWCISLNEPGLGASGLTLPQAPDKNIIYSLKGNTDNIPSTMKDVSYIVAEGN